MTDRSNRRRRHKRHKARTRSNRALLRLVRHTLFRMNLDISALPRRTPRFAFLEDPK